MWSMRPFNPRCGTVCDGRAGEGIALRLCAMLGVTERLGRPSLAGCLNDGLPNEENRDPAPAKFGTPPEKCAPPKPTAPPRLPTPPPTCPAAKAPPRKPPPWNPPPKPPPPWKPPPPPPPFPAACIAGLSATQVMPTSKLIICFVFMFHDRSRYAS